MTKRLEGRPGACGKVLRLTLEPSAWVALAIFAGATACGDAQTSRPLSEAHDSHEEEPAEHAGETTGHGDEGGHEDEEESVEISREVQQRFGIEVVAAAPGSVEVTLDLPGEIRPDPDRVVHVKPPFAGIIKRVYKHVGDAVKSGETLATLESSRALAEYPIKAAIEGMITEEHVPIGEAVDTSHALFTVADTSVVWVELQVPASDMQRVQKGNSVEILLRGAPSTRGTIFFVNPVVDEVTRTASARVVLRNDGALRPGLFVTGRVAVATEQAGVSVPSSALVRDGDGWVVFVREGDVRFSKHPVLVRLRGLDRTAIQSGIETGTEVVSNGAFLVKSAAARSEMGGGHSH